MIISGCFQLTEDVVVYVGLRAHTIIGSWLDLLRRYSV
jgi:hypothetical protein